MLWPATSRPEDPRWLAYQPETAVEFGRMLKREEEPAGGAAVAPRVDVKQEAVQGLKREPTL